MIPALAYARALSLPGGGARRAWVEVAALLGAGGAFASTPLPAGMQVLGGAVVAQLPALLALAGAPSAGGGPRPPALPTLPLTSTDRVVALVGVSTLRMLPAAVVVAVVNGDLGFVAGRLLAAVGILAGMLAGLRLLEARGVGRGGGQLAFAAMLGAVALPVAATPWALVPGGLALGLLRLADPGPGVLPGQAAATVSYVAHRLDARADARPLLTAARAYAARLGLRDGLVAGAVLLGLIAGHTALMGEDPVADLEELRAALGWGLADPQAWSFAFILLGIVGMVPMARSAALPGHSPDPTVRANGLAALRWLPVRRADVWRDAARVVAAGWGATWAGAMIPLGLALAWVGVVDALGIILFALSTLAAGLAACLLCTELGPLKAYDEGPRPASPVPMLVATAIQWIPLTLAFTVTLTFRLLGDADVLLAWHLGFLAMSVVALAAVAARYRALATREPSPGR